MPSGPSFPLRRSLLRNFAMGDGWDPENSRFLFFFLGCGVLWTYYDFSPLLLAFHQFGALKLAGRAVHRHTLYTSI